MAGFNVQSFLQTFLGLVVSSFKKLTGIVIARRRELTRLIVGAFAIVMTLMSGFFLYSYLSYRIDKADYQKKISEWQAWLSNSGEKATPSILIYDRNNDLIGEYLPERGSHLLLHQCQSDLRWLKTAAVSAEDRNFYHHGGVSWRGVSRAFFRNLLSLSAKEGGGSITQQVARNLFTDRSFSLKRKLLETFLAYDLEAALSKDEILCLYLNRIYMGEGRVGAEEASWLYFNKPPLRLSAFEAAMIVGLFPSPARYSPLNNLKLSLQRQRIVLQTMVRDGHLQEADIDKELTKFKKQYRITDDDPGLVGGYGASRDFRINRAPSPNEAVREFLYENLPEEIVRKGGLRVYTTIDLRQQMIALEEARTVADKLRDSLTKNSLKFNNDANLGAGLNPVIISMTVPDGEIRALVGGARVTEGGSQTQRIYHMKRQPGSSIKGFLYASALDERLYRPYDRVIDEAINIRGYAPRNWYRSYRGEISLRQAVAWSVNTVAVKTLDRIGVDYFRNQLARTLDMSLYDAGKRFEGGLSLALGTGELTPLELCRLYAVILNQGRTVEPKLVLRIEDKDGTPQWIDAGDSSSVKIISKKAAAGTLWLLEGVVDSEEDGTAGWVGRLRKKNKSYMPFDVAGKSGTTQTPDSVRKKYHGMPGVRDSWFVGLIPGEVTVSWIGHDKAAPIPTEANAGVLWAGYISRAHETIEGEFPDVTEYYGRPDEIQNDKTDDADLTVSPTDTDDLTDHDDQSDDHDNREDESTPANNPDDFMNVPSTDPDSPQG